tara:strand:- start:17191 stop:17586 length:396 start_codon:yes stop_codon:yes gene_type:complete
MASLNKILLIGNLGKDPEFKEFPNGDKIANFSLATSDKWTDKVSQEKKELTQWHRVVVKNKNIVRTIENYVKKGSAVVVEGKLTYRKFTTSDGLEKMSTEIIVGPFDGNLTLLPGNADIKKDNELDDEIPF